MASRKTVPKEAVKAITDNLTSVYIELGQILKECKTIESEVNEIFAGSGSKRGRKLKITARQLSRSLDKCQEAIISASNTLNEQPSKPRQK